jgi:hypothetical protein
MELEPSCFLADPMEIIDGEFRKFPRYTNQRNVLLYSESLATLATPDPEILSKYKEVLPPDDEILQ